jgi:hypothetical protein
LIENDNRQESPARPGFFLYFPRRAKRLGVRHFLRWRCWLWRLCRRQDVSFAKLATLSAAGRTESGF